VWDWLGSLPLATAALATGVVRRRRSLVGDPLRMSDGQVYEPFRHTVKDPDAWRPDTSPAVLQARFHLLGTRADQRAFHWLFRHVCIVTTPFFVGLPGYRSKLWMTDPATGDYAGLYEWDSFREAQAYVRGLMPILRALSRAGSVSYEIVADTTVEEYLGISSTPAAA
jgi:hypothetical protein